MKAEVGGLLEKTTSIHRISPFQPAVHDLLARPAEAMDAIIKAFQTIEFGVGGHHAGDAFVITVVVEAAVVADFVDGDGRYADS